MNDLLIIKDIIMSIIKLVRVVFFVDKQVVSRLYIQSAQYILLTSITGGKSIFDKFTSRRSQTSF